MKTEYTPSGVCARKIEFEIVDGIVKDVKFIGGCAGNALGISALVKGKKVEEVIDKLKGLPCGSKDTSCPDQLAKALKENI